MNLTINIAKAIPPDTLNRQQLENHVAYALRVLFVKHIKLEATRRHASANKLSATPTGHLENATVELADNTLFITSPGISRALHPILLRPLTAKALTIPCAAESYGKRARELSAKGWSLFKNKKYPDILFGNSPAGKIKPLFLLRSQALLPQDRSLLPESNAIITAIHTAIDEFTRTKK